MMNQQTRDTMLWLDSDPLYTSLTKLIIADAIVNDRRMSDALNQHMECLVTCDLAPDYMLEDIGDMSQINWQYIIKYYMPHVTIENSMI